MVNLFNPESCDIYIDGPFIYVTTEQMEVPVVILGLPNSKMVDMY